MAHFALLWKARTIEKYRQNYENEKYISMQNTNIPMPQKSLSQRLRCYRQDTQKQFSKIFQKIYPEGSSLSNFFLYLKTDQVCLHLVLKSLLGFLIGLGLTYLCFLFLVFQLSISLFHATVVSSIIGILLTMGLAFSYRIRCLIFLLLPQFFSRAGRYTLTCYALVLILTGPATNTLKNSEVLTESMACRQEQIKTLLNEVKDTVRKPLNDMRYSIKVMVQKIHLFAKELKQTLLAVNRLTLSILESIQSTFSWLQWLSDVCNKVMGSPFDRCLKVFKEKAFINKRWFERKKAQIRRMAYTFEEICSNTKKYREICVFTDFVNGSFVASIRRRLKDYAERIRNLLYLQIHVHHSYSITSSTNHSASQVAAGIVTEIRKRADPLLTWLSWSSCVTSLFLLLIIFRAKYYQHMFETRSRFDNKYITKELRDLDLNRLRHGRETILPLNKRERSKYVSTTSFRLVASEKIHLNRSIVFMAITTFKLLIHMVADYSLYWVLMTIRYHGKKQTLLPVGVPNAGMHITGTGRIADMFRSLLSALTSPVERPQPSPTNCLPDPHPPDLQRYTQIGILIFLLWFFALFEPYGLRLRHVIMGLYRPERAKARAEWLYDHIIRTRAGFMKFARRKLHRSYKYCSEEKHTLKRWLNEHILFCWLRCLLGISREEAHCLLCNAKQDPTDPNTKLQKCNTKGCPGIYCCSCFSDIGELCTICLSPTDYGDLSDVSLEKGSSDESDDDDDSDGIYAGDTTINEAEFGEQDMLGSNEDDILLPKPLRDNTKTLTRNKESGCYYFLTTRFMKQTFNLNHELLHVRKTFLNFECNVMQNLSNGNVIVKVYLSLTINSIWNIFMSNSININDNDNKVNNRPENKKNEDINENSSEKSNKGHSGQNQHESKKKQSIPVSRIIGERNDDKGNNSDGSNENRNNNNNNKEIQKDGENCDDNIGPEDKIKPGQDEKECSCYIFKQINAIFYSHWLGMKNNLLNSHNSVNQSLINNCIDERNNFKTRKKVTAEFLKSCECPSDTEDLRRYRICTFLADKEWAIKKTIRYESKEKTFSLLNGKPDTSTIELLKQDLFSHVANYNRASCTQCAKSSLSKRPKGSEQNTDKCIDPKLCNPNVKQVLVCDDYNHDCVCPANPITVFADSPAVHKVIGANECKGRRIIITDMNTSPLNSKSGCCGGPRPKKGVMEKMKTCLKSLCCSTKKKKARVCCNNKLNSCTPKKSQSHIVIIEGQNIGNCKRITNRNQSTQVDYCSDIIQHHCQDLLTKTGGGCCSQTTIKPCKGSFCESPPRKCNNKCDCRIRQQSKCDSLCLIDCKSRGRELDQLMSEIRDTLRQIESKSKAKAPCERCGCDPPCPCKCACKGRGNKITKRAELCPGASCYQNDVQGSVTDCKRQTTKADKCFCPVHNRNNARHQIEPIVKLKNSTCTNKDLIAKLKQMDSDSKRCPEEQKQKYEKQRGTPPCVSVDNQCLEDSSDCCDAEKEEVKSSSKCGDAEIEEISFKLIKDFCSCAVQCDQLLGTSSSCSSCSVSISIINSGIWSDYTGTDNTCYACYDHDDYDRSRRRKPRFVIVPKQNQCTGTDSAIKLNIGTITDEKGLIKKRYYVKRKDAGHIRLVKHKLMENRGVGTKKVVSFRSPVYVISSSTLDIYTPSRYLLEVRMTRIKTNQYREYESTLDYD